MARKLIVEIVGDSRSYERALGRSAGATRRFESGMGRLRGSVGLTTGSLLKGAAIIGGFAIAMRKLNEGIRGSISGYADFEEAQDRIVGLVGIAKEEVESMSAEILKLGPEVGKSPKELADALYFVTSAGLRGKAAMDTLSVSAHAAAAGLGETKTVADAVTSAINAYGQSNITASQASDVLVGTVREGKTEAAALAPVIGNIAALGAQLGVSFDQVGAALAAQSRITGDARTSATQLQAVFSTLAKGAPKSVKGFAAAGLSLDTVRETLAKPGGLLKVLGQLRDAFGGNIKAAAQAFPNIRALKGVLLLVGKSADQTRGIFERMSKVTGATGKAFGAISEGAELARERLRASFQALGVQVGELITPALKVATDTLRKGVAGLSAVMPQIKAVVSPAVADLIAAFRANLPEFRRILFAIVEPIQTHVVPIVRELAGIARDSFDSIVNVFADSEGDIRAILSNLGETIKSIWVLAKPTIVFLFKTALPLALRVAIPLIKLVTSVIRLQAKVVTSSVSIIVKALDKFLGGLSALADAASHLPLVGDQFAGVSDEINAARDTMRLFAGELDAIDGKKVAVEVGVSVRRIGADASERARGATEPAGPTDAADRARKAAKETVDKVTATTTETTTATDDLTTKTTKSKTAAEKAKSAADKASEAYQRLMDSLSLKLDRARLTASFRDDIRVFRLIQDAIRDRIKEVGRTTELQRELFQASQDLKAAQADSRKALQFEALGLTAEGEQRIPSVGALRKALGNVSEMVKGTFLDTRKTRNLLRSIRRILSGGLGAVGRDVRAKIQQILGDMNRQLRGEEGGEGPQTAFKKASTRKIVAGLGLSSEQVKELRARLSQIGPGGTDAGAPPTRRTGGRKPQRFGSILAAEAMAPRAAAAADGGTVVVVQGDLVLPGIHNPADFEKWVQKKARKTRGQRRGARPGVNRGGA
jgi:TP901 family phage tail tape measure protein